MNLTPSPARDLNVLVLEDNVDHAALIENALKSKDECFRVDLCNQKGEFLSLLKEKRYDAAVVDYYVGETHGLEILKELADHHSTLPVILISGIDNAELIQKGLAAGASDFVIKSRTALKSLPVVVKRSIIRKMSTRTSEPLSTRRLSKSLQSSLGKISRLSGRLKRDLMSGQLYNDEMERLEQLLAKTSRLLRKAKKTKSRRRPASR